MTDKQTKSLTELCWFFGPSLLLFALLIGTVAMYESELTVERAEASSAMDGWGKAVVQMEMSKGSLKICSERLETAVKMLAGKQVRETIVTPNFEITAACGVTGQPPCQIHEAVPGTGIYRADADHWTFLCRGKKVWERDGPMPTRKEMEKMKPSLCP